MKRIFQGVATNLIVALVIAIAFLVPAYCFHWFSETSITWFREKYFWMFWGFGLALAGCPRFWLAAVVLGLLGILELSQFGSLAFSGEYITPFSIGLMSVEFLEVVETAGANFLHFFYVPLIVGLPYLGSILLLRLTREWRFKSRWFIPLIIVFLLFPLVRIKTHTDRDDIVNFFPTPNNPTLINTLNSYSLWLGVLVPERLFGTGEKKEFPPYKITESINPPPPMTIVLIMGESLTPSHMSLFGYTRPTTPFLDSLVEDPAFIYTRGFSAANATRSSLPMFYTVQYHPLDEGVLQRQDSNLFRLAKRHGFTTYYLSAQNSNCLNGISINSIDRMISSEVRPEVFERQKDEGLLHLLREIKPSSRDFIVIHQRNLHLPYQTNTQHRPEFWQYPVEGREFQEATINAYDNGVLYVDFLYQEIVKTVRKMVDGPIYFFITSDHGEELGNSGHWGHDQLNLDSPSVPILFYGIDADPAFIGKLREKSLFTHYEMGRKIAEVMGWQISNPAEEDGVVYVNGVASFGRSGYMRFRRGKGDKPEDLQVIR